MKNTQENHNLKTTYEEALEHFRKGEEDKS